MAKLAVLLILFNVFSATMSSDTDMYSSEDSIKMFMAAEFQQRVIAKGEVWLIKFYSKQCGHCVSMAPVFKEAAKALKGIVNVGAVDITANPKLSSEYASEGVPTILLFNLYDGKPKEYNGPRKSLNIVRFILNSFDEMVKQRLGIKDDDVKKEKRSEDGEDKLDGTVINLTDDNFDSELEKHNDKFWLVEFFAPWCGHCKSLAPEWTKAAKFLKGKAILAAVDATVHNKLSSRFAIQGFPTIKAFLPNKHLSPVDYDGPRDASGIAQWVRNHMEDVLPAPKVVELISQKVFDEATSNAICVVAFLPHLLDCQSKCRNKYLNLMQELAVEFKRNQWGWLWTEGMMLTDFEEMIGVGGFGYPAMVVLNSKKKIYAILKGAFTKQEFPKFNTTEPWDGKDFEYSEEYDEIETDDTPTKVEL
ncbi:hypothetical protein GJ496_004492 [Pomphorhynchus laevis]|nr:hypothetical protein GJ496_004492 [Pomphorhynchus laevis]